MTISERTLQNGKKAYTAQVRITRIGVKYSDSKTFASHHMAVQWEKRKAKELRDADAVQLLRLKRAPSGSLTGVMVIDRYLSGPKKLRKSVASALNFLKRCDFAQRDWTKLIDTDFIDFANELARGAKPAPIDPANPTENDLIITPRSPATVANYFSYLTTLMKHGGSTFGVRLPLAELEHAKMFLKHTEVIGKSKMRKRRPSRDELDRLLAYSLKRYKEDRRRVPMHLIILNQITGCNRRGETTRGLWEHYDETTGYMLVEDMKHPRNKAGNDVRVRVRAEQHRTIQAMPRTKDRIFPYHSDTLSRLFKNACDALGIVDLHFHDLRHEGISRLFECGLSIPEVSDVSGHMDWAGLKRYTHLRDKGDPYAGWAWIDRLMAGEFDIKEEK